MTIYPVEQQECHRRAAETAWHVTIDQGNEHMRYVEAEADTGSRYAVAISELPPAGHSREGGPILVTVIAPWQAAYALQPQGPLVLSYVAEHLGNSARRATGTPTHAGDLAALTMTIAYALDRRAYLNA